MPYDLFPSVDENFNFPEEVRVQLAKSEQLRNLLIPMSETVRDALSGEELWFGRTIFNTTSKKIESWTNPGVWVEYLDDTYDFPEPPPFWDENYDVPVQVRSQLAKSEQLRNMVTPMSETARNSLPVEETWNGRTIFNTTSRKLQVWFETAQGWLSVLDENYVPIQPEWWDFEPQLKYYIQEYSPQNYTSSGRHIATDSMASSIFNIEFYNPIGAEPYSSHSLIIPSYWEVRSGDLQYPSGNLLIDYTAVGGGIKTGLVRAHNGNYTGEKYPLGYFELLYVSEGEYLPLKANSPHLLTNGCKISGQITYYIANVY